MYNNKHQCKTPIYNFVKKYADEEKIRLHMPGHKGKTLDDIIAYKYDITEISGADSLFDSSGIIRESEEIASRLYHTDMTCYSTGGSTLCIQAMLTLMKQENRTVIAVRNVHRSFISACVLLDIQPIWLFPEYNNGIISGEFPMKSAEKKLKNFKNACIYLTSPDYLGKIADIKSVSELCRKYNAVLLVDNAHGAHLSHLSLHPIQLGADICCDSAHKMLPALTGGAYLHIANPKYSSKVKMAMSLFGSTSPSYLIMTSLDLCNKYISNHLADDIEKLLPEINKLKKKLSKYDYNNNYNSDPFHLTLSCNGIDFSAQLRKYGIECEYADSDCIVLLFSPFNTSDEISKISDIIMKCDFKPPVHKNSDTKSFEFPKPEIALNIRKAVLCNYGTIPVEKSCGCICAGVNVPCPPAIPIVVSGEIIDNNCIDIFKRYEISNVNVL